MKKEPPSRRCRIDPIRQASEFDPPGAEPSYELDQLPYRSAKPVKLPDNEHILLAGVRQRVDQGSTFDSYPRGCFRENPLATCLLQGVDLQVEVLIGRGDASVTDKHVAKPVAQERNAT